MVSIKMDTGWLKITHTLRRATQNTGGMETNTHTEESHTEHRGGIDSVKPHSACQACRMAWQVCRTCHTCVWHVCPHAELSAVNEKHSTPCVRNTPVSLLSRMRRVQ